MVFSVIKEVCNSMEYVPLSKLYYQNEQAWNIAYEQRYNSFNTLHFDIPIIQYQRKHSFKAFLCYTNELIQLIQDIYSLKTDLVLLKTKLPDVVKDQYILSCIADEIKSTNDIEAVRSTKKEIRAWLEHLPETERVPHLQSIVEKYCLISTHADISFCSCEDIRKFYDEFALPEVMSELVGYAPDGVLFRKGKVDIQSGVVGKVVHQGVFPEEAIIATMIKALSILHDEQLPILLRIAVFHYLFAYIHPFYDGNGRMDRFISSYFLAKEFDEMVALRLSVIIKKNKSNYYKSFAEADSEINKGDLTPFCLNFLTWVKFAFKDTLNTLEHKRKQLENCVHVLNSLNLTKKELILYNYLLEAALFYGMGLTMKQLQGLTKWSRVTVQKLLDSLPDERIIIDKKIKPYRYKLNLLFLRDNGLEKS